MVTGQRVTLNEHGARLLRKRHPHAKIPIPSTGATGTVTFAADPLYSVAFDNYFSQRFNPATGDLEKIPLEFYCDENMVKI